MLRSVVVELMIDGEARLSRDVIAASDGERGVMAVVVLAEIIADFEVFARFEVVAELEVIAELDLVAEFGVVKEFELIASWRSSPG